LGYVNRYIIKEEDFAKKFVYKTIGRTLTGVNDINLQFSKRIAIDEAMVKKDVFDYHNVIFNIIKRADKNELFLSIDFQRIFEPYLERATMIEVDKYLDSMKNYNKNAVTEWLKNNYGGNNVEKQA